MKVKELKERLAMPESGEQFLTTGRIVAYIKDGLEEINMIAETHVDVQRINITKDKRFYHFPFFILLINFSKMEHKWLQ